MAKFFATVAVTAMLLTGGHYSGYGVADIAALCLMDQSSMNGKSMITSNLVFAQDPDQEQPAQPAQETDKHCERPDPNGDPNVGGVDPNKIGCHCARKCVNGSPSENYETQETRCKVHCKPDHCDCPDPCKA